MRRRSDRRRGFTLIELMIIIAILGVWVVNVADLLPMAWKGFVRVAHDHAAIESQVRLHAYLAHDLETGVPRAEGLRSLTIAMPGGRSVRYVTEVERSRVRREEAGRFTSFADARIAVIRPSLEGGSWTVRLESTVAERRPPPVLVSAWPKEVK